MLIHFDRLRLSNVCKVDFSWDADIPPAYWSGIWCYAKEIWEVEMLWIESRNKSNGTSKTQKVETGSRSPRTRKIKIWRRTRIWIRNPVGLQIRICFYEELSLKYRLTNDTLSVFYQSSTQFYWLNTMSKETEMSDLRFNLKLSLLTVLEWC